MAVPVADIVAIVVEIAVLPVVQPIFQEESAFSSFDYMLLLICLYDAYLNKHGKVCFSIVESESTFLFRFDFLFFHHVSTSFLSISQLYF